LELERNAVSEGSFISPCNQTLDPSRLCDLININLSLDLLFFSKVWLVMRAAIPTSKMPDLLTSDNLSLFSKAPSIFPRFLGTRVNALRQ